MNFEKCAVRDGFRRDGHIFVDFNPQFDTNVTPQYINCSVVLFLITGTKIIPVSALFIPVPVLELELDWNQNN